MTDSNKIKMTLNIGGQRIVLMVPENRREFTRDVEKNADGLYSRFRQMYPAKSDREIFAMVVYQFAMFFYELMQEQEDVSRIADECILAASGDDDVIAGGDKSAIQS